MDNVPRIFKELVLGVFVFQMVFQSIVSKKWTALAVFFAFLFSLASLPALAKKEARFAHLKLADLRPLDSSAYLRPLFIQRGPSSFVLDEELILDPPPIRTWAEELLMEDSYGVLSSTRLTIQEWQDKQEYLSNWNLEGVAVHNVPERQDQENFVKKRAMNYLDRRVSGEVKNPRPGTSWVTVAKVNRTLRPNSQVELAPQLKMKFRARLLQGRASVNIENPLVDASIESRVNGQTNAQIAKSIPSIGMRAQVEYRLKQKEMVSSINQRITDKLSAQVSAIQRSAASENKSDQRLELNFGSGF